MYFDTAACLKTNDFLGSPLYGHLNYVNFKNIDGNGWYTGVFPPSDGRVPAYPTDSNGNENWNMSMTTPVPFTDGTFDFKDKGVFLDSLKTYLDIVDDCDTDCQKLGGGLSVVAAINQLSIGFILLNFLCMFIGTWRWRARVFSTYCTFVSCCVQFIILIVSGTMLFTDYASMCARSLTSTAGTLQWTTSDDWQQIVTLWATQFVWMFIFVCVGMCQQYREMK